MRWFPILALLLLPSRGRGQPAELLFEHLTTHDGLSQDIVTCFHRDRFGFLWIGTEDGLNRYDGYSIVTYKHNPRDTSTLPNSRINGICDYGREDLIVTTEGGPRIYRRAANIFAPPGGALAKYAGKISGRPVCDGTGRIWLIAEYTRVLRYDPVSDSVTLFDPGSSPRVAVKDLMVDDGDSLWVTTENAVSVFRGDGSGFRRYAIVHKLANFQSPILNRSSTKDREGNLWVGTNAGLFRYDRASGVDAFVPLRFTEGGITYDRDEILGSLRWDRLGRLWLGGFNGLYCYNPRINSTARYTHDLSNPASLQSNRTYDILIDASNVLWVGSWWGGLSKADLKKERFGLVRNSPSTPFAGESNDIIAICEHPAGTFWFACQAGGITRVNFRSGEYTQFPNNPGNKLKFTPGDVLSMAGDSLNIWTAVGASVVWYHSNPGSFSTMTVPGARDHIQQIQKLYVDGTGDLWMGVERLGIVRYDPRTKTFTDYTVERRDTGSVPITGAWMFFEDQSGNLWAGGWGGNNALHRYDRDRNQFEQVPKQELQNSRTAVEDKEGNLWFGTWGFGLSRYNPESGELRQYIEQDGLPSNYVKGLLIDDRGNFWASTERGLSSFSPSTMKFRNYSTSDGLQGNLYYTGSCLKGSDGRLYFGGANGFNAFYPDSIRREEYSPPVLLTEFRVFDSPRAFDHPLSLMQQITLASGEDMFSFEYASLDYSSPNRNSYAYKLEGYDHDWVQAGTRRYASYTHLDPGRYDFRVKGTNSDGVWSSNIATIRVEVLPAFWQTWWFLGIILLTGGSLTYGFYRYRLNKLLEIERTRSAIATDLHDDIGTSLTNIALFSDLAQRDVAAGSSEATRRLEKISQTSRSLLDSMNDIVWSIKPENDALEQTILHMEDYAVDLLEDNGIDLHVQIPDELKTRKLPMAMRRNLFLIFKEAMGNILKHAGATHVQVALSSSVSKNRVSVLKVSIADNGRGFNPSSHERGNGLRNMEMRAARFGGTVVIRSSSDRGTTVEIDLPVKSPI